MNYLLLSPISLSMFLVPKLNKSKEVEKIYFWIQDVNMKETGKDLNLTDDYSKMVIVADYNEVINKHKPSDLIVLIDDVGLGQTGDVLRKQGYRVIGGSPFTDRIEDERQFA